MKQGDIILLVYKGVDKNTLTQVDLVSYLCTKKDNTIIGEKFYLAENYVTFKEEIQTALTSYSMNDYIVYKENIKDIVIFTYSAIQNSLMKEIEDKKKKKECLMSYKEGALDEKLHLMRTQLNNTILSLPPEGLSDEDLEEWFNNKVTSISQQKKGIKRLEKRESNSAKNPEVAKIDEHIQTLQSLLDKAIKYESSLLKLGDMLSSENEE